MWKKHGDVILIYYDYQPFSLCIAIYLASKQIYHSRYYFAVRCDAFKAESVVTSSDDVQKELEDLKLSCKKLKVMI